MLTYTAETTGGETLYKIEIKSIELYFYGRTAPTTEKIGHFDEIVVSTHIITFDNTSATVNFTPLKDFADALIPIKDTIKERVLEYKGTVNNGQRFLLTFADFSEFNFSFWVKEKDLPSSGVTVGDKTLTVVSGTTFKKVYTENPMTDLVFNEAGSVVTELEFSKYTREYQDKDKEDYYEFASTNKDKIYVKKDDIEDSIINLLDWDACFKKFETGDTENIICDKKTDIETYLKEEGETLESIKKQRQKLLCQHPLEFDETFYTDVLLKGRGIRSSDKITHLTVKADKLDMWEELSGLEDFSGTENNLWFAHPVYFIKHLERMGAFKKHGLERFTDKVRSLIGIPYELGGKSSTAIDCSGVIIYALNEIGYTVPDITSADMASGKIDWITVTDGDSIPQSTPGVLNFYNWGKGAIKHVNVGVGQRDREPIGQIVDATEGDSLAKRNGNQNQVIPAGTKQVNQTYEPFSTRSKPIKQGRINFDVLERKYTAKK